MEIFVQNCDWNTHWLSADEYLQEGDVAEGEEFTMVRLQVGARTTYKVENGKAVPVAVAFPSGLPEAKNGGRLPDSICVGKLEP